MERKQKVIFQLDTPYTEVHWPLTSSKDQENIFEILIRLLAPLGHHRATYVTPSKGKRNRKRKRQEAKRENSNTGLNESDALPPIPEISSHLLVGLASITRYLELISSNRRADGLYEKPETSQVLASHENGLDMQHDSMGKVRHVAAIFVCRSSQPSALHAHLPQLVATASLRNPHLPATRLVQLPQGSENKLSSALGLPRASFVAILENAPRSKPLLDLVQDLVPIIEVPWLEEARKARYMPVKVNTVLTTVPLGKNKQDRIMIRRSRILTQPHQPRTRLPGLSEDALLYKSPGHPTQH